MPHLYNVFLIYQWKEHAQKEKKVCSLQKSNLNQNMYLKLTSLFPPDRTWAIWNLIIYFLSSIYILKVPIFPELPVSFEAESWSDRLTNVTTGQRRKRKRTRRGRWSDEWLWLGRPLTSSSSGWPTNASLPRRWRPRPPGGEGGVLNSSRLGGRERVMWQEWGRQTEKGKEGEKRKNKRLEKWRRSSLTKNWGKKFRNAQQVLCVEFRPDISRS